MTKPKAVSPRHVGAVNFETPVWNLCRELAIVRGRKSGGRVSVSEVINQIVETARPKLEREVAKG
jgi:hypothetical protein